MTYREKFGRYDVVIDGTVWKWFKSLEKAEEYYEEMADAVVADEMEISLVDRKSGEILKHAEPIEEETAEEAEKTIGEYIVEVELRAAEERLEKLVELKAPEVMIEGVKNMIADLANGIIKIGGATEKLAGKFESVEWKKGRGGKVYLEFSDGTRYFPNAKYGKYID